MIRGSFPYNTNVLTFFFQYYKSDKMSCQFRCFNIYFRIPFDITLYFSVIVFPITSDENKYLLLCLNACVKLFPLVKLEQRSMKLYNEITEIISNVLGTSNEAIVGSNAEGLHILDSDTDVIKSAHTIKVFDSIREPFNMDYAHFQVIQICALYR